MQQAVHLRACAVSSLFPGLKISATHVFACTSYSRIRTPAPHPITPTSTLDPPPTKIGPPEPCMLVRGDWQITRATVVLRLRFPPFTASTTPRHDSIIHIRHYRECSTKRLPRIGTRYSTNPCSLANYWYITGCVIGQHMHT